MPFRSVIIVVALVALVLLPDRSPAAALAARLGHASQAQRLLYQTTWQQGKLGWLSRGSGHWYTANRHLYFDGGGESAFLAPAKTKRLGNYAIEARIETTGHGDYNGTYGFGVFFRGRGAPDLDPHDSAPDALGAGVVDTSAVISGIWVYPKPLAASDFDPGTGWHTYRVEVRANLIRLLIDGQVAAQKKSNKFLGGTRVGLFSMDSEIEVRVFKVFSL